MFRMMVFVEMMLAADSNLMMMNDENPQIFQILRCFFFLSFFQIHFEYTYPTQNELNPSRSTLHPGSS